MSPNSKSDEYETRDEDFAKSFFKTLIKEGSQIDGNCKDPINPEDIPWINYDLLKKGREFVKMNYAMVLTVMAVSDTLGFVAKQVASPVFKAFYPTNCCGPRFLSTFRTTMNGWLLSDFSGDPNSQYFKEIQRVRKMHRLMARPALKPVVPPEGIKYPKEYGELLQAIKQDLEHIDTTDFPEELLSWNPPMYFTQLDATLVQFGMCAPFLLYPKLVGVYTDCDEGMQGYFHMWAVIGKMLGLEDRFNLALHPDPELYMNIVMKLGFPGLKNADESVIFSTYCMVDGIFNSIVPGAVTPKSLIYSSMKSANMEGVNVWKVMGIRDKISYYQSLSTVYLLRFDTFRILMNLFVWFMLNLYIKLFHK